MSGGVKMKQELRVGKVTDSHQWIDNNTFRERYHPKKVVDAVKINEDNIQKLSSVYIISIDMEGPVKIGRTTDVWKRLCELQVGSPANLYLRGCTIETDVINEKRMHKIFHAYLIRGEWFKQSDELLNVMNIMGYIFDRGSEDGSCIATRSKASVKELEDYLNCLENKQESATI